MLSDLLLCNVFSALPLFCQGVDWAEISKQLLAVRFMAICGDSLRIAYAVAIVCRGVPRRKPHRRSGLATLPSVGAVP